MITLKITQREKELLIRAVGELSFNITESWCGTNSDSELEYEIPSSDQKEIADLNNLEDKIREES
tara:strand:- start:563 stop:757 length:195 start_codon:yes stop_codon:yes gene_type:complete